MPLWLQAVLTAALLIAVVPLFVWANTGRASSAWYALKRYLLCLGILALPALLIVPAYWFIVSP